MLYIQKRTTPGEMMRKVSMIKSSSTWKGIKDGDTNAVRDAFNTLPKDEKAYIAP